MPSQGDGGGGFGASQGPQGSPGSGGGGDAPRVNSLTPTTIKMLHDAESTADDANAFQIDGKQIAQMTIVGSIVSKTEKSTNVSLVIDDSTGQIEVVFWTTGDENEAVAAKRATWVEGGYVKVMGSLRTFAGRRNVAATHIRTVEDFNQVTFHTLAVFETHAHNTMPRIDDAGQKAAAPSGMSISSTGGGGGGAMGAAYTGPPQFTDVQRAVFMALKSCSDSGTGLSVGDISSALKTVHQSVQVKQAIDFMANEGHIYPTIDDTHFALCE